jgi:phosphoglycolate phosphatase-like HAD superfamily hydrolase
MTTLQGVLLDVDGTLVDSNDAHAAAWVKNPFLQKKQLPHDMQNGTTTRSPFLRLVTLLPTSSKTPIGSWPKTSPAFIVGMKPS